MEDDVKVEMSRNELELKIKSVWSEVLKISLDSFSVHDDFKCIGGDSLKSMAIYTKLVRLGIKYPTEKFFKYSTIAELVEDSGQSKVGLEYSQFPLIGAVDNLMPAQAWYLSENFIDAHQGNVAAVFDCVTEVNFELLHHAYGELCFHHDSLRQSFYQGNGCWLSEVSPFDDHKVSFQLVNLEMLSGSELDHQYKNICIEAQRGLSLDAGRLSLLLCIKMPLGIPDRILFIVHHLATDGYSFRVLRQDLWHYYKKCLVSGAPNRDFFSKKTANISIVGNKFKSYLLTENAKKGYEFWLSMPWTDSPDIKMDSPVTKSNNTVESESTASYTFSELETAKLLGLADGGAELSIDEALVWGLHQSLTKWNQSSISKILTVDSGRSFAMNELALDVSRTSTWLALTPPLFLIGESQSPREIKEQINACRKYGPLYEICTWMDDDVFRLPKIEDNDKIVFNYLGDMASKIGEEEEFVTRKAHYVGETCNPKKDRACIFFVSAKLVDCKLHIYWAYSVNLHTKAVVEALLGDMVEAVRSNLNSAPNK